MGAPLGNTNAEGNSGGQKGKSGRSSAYQEIADAKLLWDIFSGELDREEVTERIKSGKYSLKDRFIQKAFDGNERFLAEIFRKLFPEVQVQQHKGEFTINVKDDTYIHSALPTAQRSAKSADSEKEVQSNSVREKVGEDNSGSKPSDTGITG